MYYEVKRIELENGGFITQAFTFDGYYIGNEEQAKIICDKFGIKPEPREPNDPAANGGLGCTCSIGFCEREQKWYGWSHRAIYGFGIGSTVKRGDCGYVADTPEKLIEDHANFYADISKELAEQKRAECQILEDRSGIRILHESLVIPMVENLEDLVAALDGDESVTEMANIAPEYSIVKCGRGEWTAETLEDAKQMAIDFAEGVG